MEPSKVITIEALARELASLRGQVEDLTRRLDRMRIPGDFPTDPYLEGIDWGSSG